MAGVLSSIASGIGRIGQAIVNNPVIRGIGKAASLVFGPALAATAFFVGAITVGSVKAWSVAAIRFREAAFNERVGAKDAEREEVLRNTIGFFSTIIRGCLYSYKKGVNYFADWVEDELNQFGFGNANAAENDIGGPDIADNRKARKNTDPKKGKEETEKAVAEEDRRGLLAQLPPPPSSDPKAPLDAIPVKGSKEIGPKSLG